MSLTRRHRLPITVQPITMVNDARDLLLSRIRYHVASLSAFSTKGLRTSSCEQDLSANDHRVITDSSVVSLSCDAIYLACH